MWPGEALPDPLLWRTSSGCAPPHPAGMGEQTGTGPENGHLFPPLSDYYDHHRWRRGPILRVCPGLPGVSSDLRRVSAARGAEPVQHVLGPGGHDGQAKTATSSRPPAVSAGPAASSAPVSHEEASPAPEQPRDFQRWCRRRSGPDGEEPPARGGRGAPELRLGSHGRVGPRTWTCPGPPGESPRR